MIGSKSWGLLLLLESVCRGKSNPAYAYVKVGLDQIKCWSIRALRGTGPHTAVRPLCLSPDGRWLLYEVKQGGERTGTFEILEVKTGKILPDFLSRGYLRSFAFAPDSLSFYYVHEALESKKPHHHAAYNTF